MGRREAAEVPAAAQAGKLDWDSSKVRGGAERPSLLHNKHSPVWVPSFAFLDTHPVANSVVETIGLILNLYFKNKQMPHVPASLEGTEIPSLLPFLPKGVQAGSWGAAMA